MAELPVRQRTVVRAFAALLATVLLLAGSGRFASAQALDPTLWVTDGQVQATAIGDGRLYIGGTFGYVGPRTGGFALLEAATGTFAGRPPEVNGPVKAVVADGEGGWYIGGQFSRVAGVTRGNGAHVRADGTLDAWDPGTDGPIECLLLTANGVYVGGSFVHCGGEVASNLARVDRSTGASLHWNPAPNAVVRALATDGTKIFVGGAFSQINGQLRRAFAILDPLTVTLSPIDLNVNNGSASFVPDIFTLVYRAGKLYMGGLIISINGTDRFGACAITASTGVLTPWDPQVTSRVRTLHLSRGSVYIGGDFTALGSGAAVNRTGVAEVDTVTGAPTAWNANLALPCVVRSILDDGRQVYVGGTFTMAGTTPVKNLVAINYNGVPVTSLRTATNGTVRTLVRDGARIFVGGDQTSVGGALRTSIAALSLASGEVLPWDPGVASGTVRTIALAPDRVYFGGTFQNVGGLTRKFAAAVDTGTAVVQSWNPAPDSSVRVILVNGSSVYVGGHFRNCGGAAHKLVALVNNVTGGAAPGFDVPLGVANETATTLMYVQSLAVSGTRLYIGGLFNRVRPVSGTVTRNNACAVNSATGALAVWNPNLDNVARTIVPTANGLFVGGDFVRTTTQGPLTSVALFDTSGAEQSSFQAFADTSVSALLVNGTTITAGGGFNYLGLGQRGGLGRAAWATGVNDAWVPAPDVRNVSSLVVDPATNDLIVGGGFEMMGVHRAFGLARFKGTVPGAPAVSVTAPAPGRSVDIGTTFRIEWTASAPGSGIQSADVYVSQTGAGGPWKLLAAGVSGKSSYDWVLDDTVAPSTNNYVRVVVRDWYGNTVQDLTNSAFNSFVSVAGAPEPGAQAGFALRPLFPNPLRGAARVSFVTPRAEAVRLSVHDLQGRLLAVLADGVFAPGVHELPVDAARFPAGLYFVQLRTPAGTLTRRFVTLH